MVAIRAYRRLGAQGRRVNDCRERTQIIRFCVRGAARPMTFTAAAGSTADVLVGGVDAVWVLARVA
jgi:hypothetical protein